MREKGTVYHKITRLHFLVFRIIVKHVWCSIEQKVTHVDRKNVSVEAEGTTAPEHVPMKRRFQTAP